MPLSNENTCARCSLRPSLCHGDIDSLLVHGCDSHNHEHCRLFGWTCTCNMHLLADRIREVGNFDAELRRQIAYDPGHLPDYIPTVYHRYGRKERIDLPFAAMPMHSLFDITRDGYVPKAFSAEQLRELLGIQPETKIILTGPGPDRHVEAVWRDHRQSKLLEFLADLRVEAFTVSNFSFPRDCPPPHYRFNRGRGLRLAERAADAGLNTILHLNALHEDDWGDWENLLRRHPEIIAVCMEFQTGYKRMAVGRDALQRLIRLQANIGRPLHPIIIGGARFAEEIGRHFERCTLIDAQPFMQTYKRKICFVDDQGTIEWRPRYTDLGELLDKRFWGNIATYRHRMEQRLMSGKKQRLEIEIKARAA